MSAIAKLTPKIQTLLSLVKDVRLRSTVVGSSLVTAILVAIGQAGYLQGLELKTYDRMLRLLPSAGPDSRLLIVGISEQDLKTQKKWPISDRVMAQLLQKLQSYGPKAIGLDLYRDLPQPPGYSDFLEQLQADNVIAIQGIVEAVPAPPSIPPHRVGFNDFVLDSDNLVRRNLLYAKQGSQPFSSFALRLSLAYLSPGNASLRVEPQAIYLGQAVLPRLQTDSGGYQMAPAEVSGKQILLKYRSPDQIARQVTLTQVLNGDLDPSWVKDKIVLIGTTARSLKDIYATPYSARKIEKNNQNQTDKPEEAEKYFMPGIAIHAQMVSQILGIVLDGERQFWFWPQWGEGLWLWSWSWLGGILVWWLNRPFVAIFAAGLAVGGLWLISFGLLSQLVWIPVVAPAFGLVATSAFVLAYRVRYSKSHDPLTDLPNRHLFAEQIQKANNRKHPGHELVILLVLDLARVKDINEALGRGAGDYLLKHLTRQLQAQLSSQDRLARVGSEEFGIWLRGVDRVSQAVQIAHQLQRELTQFVTWQGTEICTAVNLGIAACSAGGDFQVEDLLRYADIALYRAQKSGRPEVFVPDMGRQIEGRWQLERDLRQGIANQEFQLYYQPIVCLKTLKLAGFEALVRWQSPQRGFVSPGEFIPIAEETGLIIPLGKWILEEACRQTRCWQEQFPHYPSLIVSVNLSGRQFVQPDLAAQIRDTLAAAGLAGNQLKLEITESMMVDDVERAIAILKTLKGLGLKLSIDDFGTGYSSLSYLHCFPIDTLKVDKSFVSRMDELGNDSPDTHIVRTIVTLGHNLQLDVVAEGIETELQLKRLQGFNCQYGQGYFFSKPLGREAASELLARDPRWEV